ncbi:MAG: hypothetical protein WAU86_02535, partial [Oricola sp.]
MIDKDNARCVGAAHCRFGRFSLQHHQFAGFTGQREGTQTGSLRPEEWQNRDESSIPPSRAR